MRLNIGCGNHRADGWINVDITVDDAVRPDVQADLTEHLPWRDGIVERIYLGHVLEHIAIDRVPRALAECRRVLSVGGIMSVVGPDCDIADRMLDADELDAEEHRLVVEGAGRWAGDVHQWRSTAAETERLLVDAGFTVLRTTIGETGRSIWPLTSGVAWQFALIALPTGAWS